eukprot:scaffold98271_cov63-Phaeocystis_antarctica.AAC.3
MAWPSRALACAAWRADEHRSSARSCAVRTDTSASSAPSSSPPPALSPSPDEPAPLAPPSPPPARMGPGGGRQLIAV